MTPPTRVLRGARAGFTLAELIVATTIITIVMTAVYVSFSKTIQIWRRGEAHLQEFQEIRTALSTMEFELARLLEGTNHLVRGTDDEIEFFTVSAPMNTKEGEGERVLCVKYRYNRTGKKLVREESIVKEPLPSPLDSGAAVDDSRIVLDQTYTFTLASKVRDFKVSYCWIPTVDRALTDTPQWTEPLVLEENRRGWGLPQGVQIEVTFDDETAEKGKRTFASHVAFRTPTTVQDPSRVRGGGGHEL